MSGLRTTLVELSSQARKRFAAAALAIAVAVGGNTAYAGRLPPSLRPVGAALSADVPLGAAIAALLVGVATLFVLTGQSRGGRGKHASVPAKQPAQFIGIDIGRTRIGFGVLRITASDRRRLPLVAEDVKFIYTPDALEWHERTHSVYAMVTKAIAQCCKQDLGKIDGIGIALPGQLDVAGGRILDAGQFLGTTDFVENLARALVTDSDVCSRLLGSAGAASTDQRICRLQERIHIDNDVNCGARFLLAKHRDTPGWENYASLFVGTGVGAGFVFGREMYYGSRSLAGEVGHMVVNVDMALESLPGDLPPVVSAAVANHVKLSVDECQCGQRGVHWESLISGAGLARLATHIDPVQASRLADVFAAMRPRTSKDLVAADIGLAARLLEQSPVTHPDGMPEGLPELMRDPKVALYVRRVIRVYAALFAIGVTNLLNTLNLDHIGLGGGVMDGLGRLRLFVRFVSQGLDRYALPSSVRTFNGFYYPEEGARPEWGWRGAALLLWDPSYYAAAGLS